MTEKELSQLYWLNRETEKLQETLQNKCSNDLYHSPIITGLPKGNAHIDKLAEYAAETDEIRQLIELNLKKIQIERARLERYIAGIEDAETRLIFRLRCINGMFWEDIAAEMTMLDDNGNVLKSFNRTTVMRKFKKYISARNAHQKNL